MSWVLHCARGGCQDRLAELDNPFGIILVGRDMLDGTTQDQGITFNSKGLGIAGRPYE